MKTVNITLSLVVHICFVLLLRENSVQCSFSVGNILQSALDTSMGIAQKIPESIPSPEALFSSAKNVIAGYPFEAAFRAINLFCSAALAEKTVKPKVLPNLETVNFILFTNTSNFSIPLKNPHLLWKHHAFNPAYPLELLVTGWTSNINSTNSALDTVRDAYRCRGNVNFVVIDTAQYVDTLYTWSAFNTEAIGNLIGEGLKDLVEFYPLDKIHLIGHSLGAHIVGAAGRNFNYLTSKLLPRITGLDPASPCFNEGENLSGLSRGDAQFVDVIHSNPGALGKRDPIGDADFYPNGLDPLPPGCITVICAHARAWEFYAETVYPGNENAFMGVKCGSLTALNTGYCPGKRFPMGYAVPLNLKGNYFLKTSSKRPFGTNSRKHSDVLCNLY